MTTSMIELQTAAGETFSAYIAKPDGPAISAVIVLQEIFGVNANIRGVADRFAEAGHVAIAPDLFWRQQPGVQLDPSSAEDREAATVYMKGLDTKLAVEDVLVAASAARGLIGGGGAVGVVGYCLGGKLAYLLATCPGIDAAVSYYGVAIQSVLDKAQAIQCPLLLHIAEEDHLCPPAAQQEIIDVMAMNRLATVATYAGVGHAFARRGGAGFDKSSADRADEATAAFLSEHLLSR